MNIRDLEAFRIIAAEQSITRASKLLYITPQGLSKIVKNMERELDCELLARMPNGVRLTEGGKCLLEYAQTAIASFQNLKKEISYIRQKNQSVVDLLSAYGILRLVTPDCILEFKKKYPDLVFHYREYPDLQVERLFAKRNGNVAFSIGDFDKELYEIVPLESFPIKLLVNEKHPLSQRESVTIDDLRGEQLYIESSEFKIYHLITDRCREAGFVPDIVFETSGFSLCHKMVKANKGISVTVDFVYDDMSGRGMRMIPFSDGIYEWRACMITRKGEDVSNAVTLFRDHIQDWIRKIKEGKIVR